MNSHRRAPSLVPWAGLALFAVIACSAPQPYVANIDAVAIVQRNSADAFMSFFTASRDDAAFRSFGAGITAAHSRAELTTAWRAVPTLAAQGADFLDQHVFARSIAEHRWPKARPPAAMEPDFVQGVQLGTRDFLGGR